MDGKGGDDVDYLFEYSKKRSSVILVAFFYVAIQLFLLLNYDGPTAANLQDGGSLYVMQTMKSINTTTLAQRINFHRFGLSLKYAPAPRPCAEAFLEELHLSTYTPSAWKLWALAIGEEKESQPSSNMVFRK